VSLHPQSETETGALQTEKHWHKNFIFFGFSLASLLEGSTVILRQWPEPFLESTYLEAAWRHQPDPFCLGHCFYSPLKNIPFASFLCFLLLRLSLFTLSLPFSASSWEIHPFNLPNILQPGALQNSEMWDVPSPVLFWKGYMNHCQVWKLLCIHSSWKGTAKCLIFLSNMVWSFVFPLCINLTCYFLSFQCITFLLPRCPLTSATWHRRNGPCYLWDLFEMMVANCSPSLLPAR
jgi:hypothetical protein